MKLLFLLPYFTRFEIFASTTRVAAGSDRIRCFATAHTLSYTLAKHARTHTQTLSLPVPELKRTEIVGT